MATAYFLSHNLQCPRPSNDALVVSIDLPHYCNQTFSHHLHRSYTSLSPRVRLGLGLGLIANAALALAFSDQIEAFLGMKPSQEDQQRLAQSLPRLSAMERSAGSSQKNDR